MQEDYENGVKLSWLIDPQNKQAFVYRKDASITQYPNFCRGQRPLTPNYII